MYKTMPYLEWGHFKIHNEYSKIILATKTHNKQKQFVLRIIYIAYSCFMSIIDMQIPLFILLIKNFIKLSKLPFRNTYYNFFMLHVISDFSQTMPHPRMIYFNTNFIIFFKRLSALVLLHKKRMKTERNIHKYYVSR